MASHELWQPKQEKALCGLPALELTFLSLPSAALELDNAGKTWDEVSGAVTGGSAVGRESSPGS